MAPCVRMDEGIEMLDYVELLLNVFLVERLARESSGERGGQIGLITGVDFLLSVITQ